MIYINDKLFDFFCCSLKLFSARTHHNKPKPFQCISTWRTQHAKQHNSFICVFDCRPFLRALRGCSCTCLCLLILLLGHSFQISINKTSVWLLGQRLPVGMLGQMLQNVVSPRLMGISVMWWENLLWQKKRWKSQISRKGWSHIIFSNVKDFKCFVRLTPCNPLDLGLKMPQDKWNPLIDPPRRKNLNSHQTNRRRRKNIFLLHRIDFFPPSNIG